MRRLSSAPSSNIISSTGPVHIFGLNLLNGIFNASTYSVVGSGGSADDDGNPHAGADVFFGGNRADIFNGRPGPFGPMDPGSDTVDYSHATSAVSVNLLTGATSGTAAANDVFISIENLRGTNFADILTGDGNNNVLEGGAGDDTLDGAGGSNTADYEHATLGAGGVGVAVNLTIQGGTNSQNTELAGFDTLINIQNVRGSAGNDTLTGTGSSVLEGGAGHDNLIGQSGQSDTASYEHATAGVTVNLASQGIPQNTYGAGSDTLTNIANLTGSQFNDILTGDSGNNILFGNGGSDTFVFNASSGNDTIGDFIAGQDHIELDYAAFEPDIPGGFNSWIDSHATAVGSDLLIDLNNDSVDTILLKNVSLASLHASDFIVPAGSMA